MKDAFSWGNVRKWIVLFLIFCWLGGYFWKHETLDNRAFWIFAGLVALYLIEVLYSIVLSAKASFMFQTAIPFIAFLLVGILAYTEAIDSAATITLFALSLGYTAYVVGKKLNREQEYPGLNREQEYPDTSTLEFDLTKGDEDGFNDSEEEGQRSPDRQ